MKTSALWAAVLAAGFCGATTSVFAQRGTVADLRRCESELKRMQTLPLLKTKDSVAIAESLRRSTIMNDSATALAEACSDRIKPSALPDSLLEVLATIQSRARRSDALMATLVQIADGNGPPEDRLQRLSGLAWGLRASDKALGLQRRMVALADSAGEPMRRVAQRVSLTTATRAIDPLAAYGEANRTIAFVATLDSTTRSNLSSVIQQLVFTAGQWAVADSNPMYLSGIVARATAAAGVTPQFISAMTTDLDRVAVVGAPALDFEGEQWLNMPAGEKRVSVKGKVTLVEFTSQWCTACKPTYRPIQAMYKELGPRGFQAVFSVPEEVTEEPLISIYQKLFAHYGVEFPVQVGESGKYSRYYKVGAIPHFLIIDRRGIVRDMFVGWDAARASKVIERLLAET